MRPPTRVPARREPVRAEYIEERGETVRIGVLTEAILSEYPEHAIGRVTDVERQAVDSSQSFQTGTLSCIPVNIGEEVSEIRAIRLDDGLGVIVGQRTADNALVAKAFTFREPHWDTLAAEDTVRRFGYEPPLTEEEERAERPVAAPDPAALAAEMATAVTTAVTTAMAEVMKNVPVPNITIQLPNGDVAEVKPEPEEDPEDDPSGE